MRYFAGRSVLGRTIRNGRLTQTVIETSWRLVLRQGMAAAALGMVLGIVAALGLARLVSSMLLGVAPPS